jgi:hypothetical protein
LIDIVSYAYQRFLGCFLIIIICFVAAPRDGLTLILVVVFVFGMILSRGWARKEMRKLLLLLCGIRLGSFCAFYYHM